MKKQFYPKMKDLHLHVLHEIRSIALMTILIAAAFSISIREGNAQGNLLYKQYYGGNSVTDPRFGPALPPGAVTYSFYSGPGVNPSQPDPSFFPTVGQYTAYSGKTLPPFRAIYLPVIPKDTLPVAKYLHHLGC